MELNLAESTTPGEVGDLHKMLWDRLPRSDRLKKGVLSKALRNGPALIDDIVTVIKKHAETNES